MARKPTAAPGKVRKPPLAKRLAKPRQSKVPAGANVFAQPKHAGGRPTKYDPKYPEQVAKLCALGATDEEIADFFEVSKMTIIRWREQYPNFADATRTGKEAADERVERSLFQMAVGYEHRAVKIFMPAGADQPVYAEHREHVQGNAAAAIFWLKNRRRDLWRDKQEHEHTGLVKHEVSIDEYRAARADIIDEV